jgi:uncharacterized iron-regulated protein
MAVTRRGGQPLRITRIGRLTLTVILAGLPVAMLSAQGGEVPHRVVDAAAKRGSDFEALLADVARADVVFVGEQHQHAGTHRLELALLEGLARRQRDVTVALEMFDRDVQDPLEHFLMGHLSEAEFRAAARPWPGYATDYKPLVDFALARAWPVVATNAPRALVEEVARGGLEVLSTTSDAERAFVAREIRCPKGDAYFKRFQEAQGAGADRVDGAYFAQCLRDETMGETIAQVLTVGAAGGKRPLVVSINGAFQTAFGQGVVERTRRRLPDKRLLVIAIVPVENLDAVTTEISDPPRADYIVYVR